MAVAFAIFPGLNDIEFILPKTQQRLVYAKHLSYFSDGIILSLKQCFIVRDIDQVCLGIQGL